MPDPIKVFCKTPGQLVQGHPMKTSPVLDDKTKVHLKNSRGELRNRKFFSVAYPKGDPAVEAMIKKIRDAGPAFWDSKIAAVPDFKNKLEDGDSTVGNSKGKSNAERAGFSGCWIIKFTTELPDMPRTCDENKEDLFEDGEFKPGDYVRVGLSISSNKSKDSPGLYVNPIVVMRVERGDAIFTQRTAAEEIDEFDNMDDEPDSAPAPKPAKDFGMAPPPPTPPATPSGPRTVTNKDGGVQLYDAMIGQGWTDETLADNGWS